MKEKYRRAQWNEKTKKRQQQTSMTILLEEIDKNTSDRIKQCKQNRTLKNNEKNSTYAQRRINNRMQKEAKQFQNKIWL